MIASTMTDARRCPEEAPDLMPGKRVRCVLPVGHASHCRAPLGTTGELPSISWPTGKAGPYRQHETARR